MSWILNHNKNNNNEYENYYTMGKYLAIQDKNHKRSDCYGSVYIHILQAEKKLNRELKDNEVVHHKNEDKHDNSEENLIVFRTKADHTSFHSGSEIYQNEDGSYSAIYKKYCECGNIKDYKAAKCIQCYNKERKCFNKPEKEVLITALDNFSKTRISEMYDVSRTTINRWKNSYNITDEDIKNNTIVVKQTISPL